MVWPGKVLQVEACSKQAYVLPADDFQQMWASLSNVLLLTNTKHAKYLHIVTVTYCLQSYLTQANVT